MSEYKQFKYFHPNFKSSGLLLNSFLLWKQLTSRDTLHAYGFVNKGPSEQLRSTSELICTFCGDRRDKELST